MHARTRHAAAASRIEHVTRLETERMIQRGRLAALVLFAGLIIAFGSDRSVRITIAAALLAVTTVGVQLLLRRGYDRRALVACGWVSFLADTAVCAIALSAVADDPVDPIGVITVIIAIEAAVRWGSRGAVIGGLLAGAMAVAWAASGYAATGRDLPATSIAFRLLSVVVLALPVGMLIERLRRQQQHTRRLFESSNDAILIVSGHRLVAVNEVAADLAAAPADRLVGRPFGEAYGEVFETDDVIHLVRQTSDGPRRVPVIEGDEQRWLDVRAEATGDAGLVFVTARDVTEDRNREEELRFRAWHDHLTGLPNRAALRSRLGGLLTEHARVGVVFLDLDDFKDVNDGHGHLAGDDVLVEVADRLRQLTRQTDAAYRWAGDEFCIVVHPATADVLATIAERITAAFEHGFGVADQLVTVGASIGTALARPGDTEATLLARADEWMYRSKGEGTVRLFPAEVDGAS